VAECLRGCLRLAELEGGVGALDCRVDGGDVRFRGDPPPLRGVVESLVFSGVRFRGVVFFESANALDCLKLMGDDDVESLNGVVGMVVLLLLPMALELLL